MQIGNGHGKKLSNTSDSMEKFNEMLVPQRSKTRYENVYREYELWCSERKKDPLVEESACLYLHESKKTRKATTLCSYYSAIKNQLLVHHGVNANNWTRNVAFLKRAGEDETKKKAKVFTREEIETFLDLNSERICVREKLAFLFGVFGALRAEELSALKFEDVTMVDDETLKITIKSSKTDKAGRGFEFFAVSMPAANVVAMYAEYKSCVNDPSPDSRLFRKETKSGYGSAVLGRQHFYALPKRIATELGLPPQRCTLDTRFVELQLRGLQTRGIRPCRCKSSVVGNQLQLQKGMLMNQRHRRENLQQRCVRTIGR